MSDNDDFDYHLSQRYHGPSDPVFLDALGRVPLSDQWVERCSDCGHMTFVQRSARMVSKEQGVPDLCAHCAVRMIEPHADNVLNLPPCPAECGFA
jgi:hypothetical protein